PLHSSLHRHCTCPPSQRWWVSSMMRRRHRWTLPFGRALRRCAPEPRRAAGHPNVEVTSTGRSSHARDRIRQHSLVGLVALAVGVSALLMGVRARVAVPPAAAAPVTVYAVTAANPPHLITFSSAAPGTILSDVTITGLLTQTVAGIEFRPATSVLYAVGFVSS